MALKSRALLIAAPYGDLEGPERDVEDMARVLHDRGFQLTKCCGLAATRAGILQAWEKLITEISKDDAVVIYYSGHGSFLLSGNDGDTGQRAEDDAPWYYQFIVPMDFNPKAAEFTGLLELQMSQLLLRTTARTHNVTVILDCCHSGRMMRDPDLGARARLKKQPPLLHESAFQHARKLELQGQLQGKTFAQGNPHVVQLAATAPWEEAAEFPDEKYGEYRGVFTTALVQAIHDAGSQEVSWKTIMAYVTELVHARSSRQRPWVGGPDTRFLFSLDGRDSDVLPVKLEGDTAIIRAGRVGGVCLGNIYAVMPPGTERADPHRQIALAIVTHVDAFQAYSRLEFDEERTEGAASVPADGLALGFIITQGLHKWQVQCPVTLPALRQAIEGSKLLKIAIDDSENPLITFSREADKLSMKNSGGVLVGQWNLAGEEATTGEIGRILRDAEIFARARHFLTIQSTEVETLDADVLAAVHTNVYLVEKSRRARLIQTTGEDGITEQQYISIQLKNDSPLDLYVSVLSVEVTGVISMLASKRQVPKGKDEAVSNRRNPGGGMEVQWPPGEYPRDQPIVETIVFVISDVPVDLRYLATPPDGHYREHRKAGVGNTRSRLDDVVQSLAYGHNRRVPPPDEDDVQMHWNIRQSRFLVRPKV